MSHLLVESIVLSHTYNSAQLIATLLGPCWQWQCDVGEGNRSIHPVTGRVRTATVVNHMASQADRSQGRHASE